MKYEEDQLREVVSKSCTLNEVLDYYKKNKGGGNYEILRRKLKKWNIDISHFLTRSQIVKKANAKRRISLEEWLVKDSKCKSNSGLKQKLYKIGLKQPICEECGQDENWRGKKMSLILDHVNGDHFDNRIENLRIVCPNCNATLDTHCGKNKKI